MSDEIQNIEIARLSREVSELRVEVGMIRQDMSQIHRIAQMSEQKKKTTTEYLFDCIKIIAKIAIILAAAKTGIDITK